MDYGSGYIWMSRSTRDFDFAKKYNLEIIPVVSNNMQTKNEIEEAYTGEGKIITPVFK